VSNEGLLASDRRFTVDPAARHRPGDSPSQRVERIDLADNRRIRAKSPHQTGLLNQSQRRHLISALTRKPHPRRIKATPALQSYRNPKFPHSSDLIRRQDPIVSHRPSQRLYSCAALDGFDGVEIDVDSVMLDRMDVKLKSALHRRRKYIADDTKFLGRRLDRLTKIVVKGRIHGFTDCDQVMSSLGASRPYWRRNFAGVARRAPLQSEHWCVCWQSRYMALWLRRRFLETNFGPIPSLLDAGKFLQHPTIRG
jgi:hypothetical protein